MKGTGADNHGLLYIIIYRIFTCMFMWVIDSNSFLVGTYIHRVLAIDRYTYTPELW